MSGWAPLLRSITLTISTITQLSAKLAVLDANLPTRLGLLVIEYDLTALGNLYIGNSTVAANNCGRHMVPGQNYVLSAADFGVVFTTDVYLFSDNATNQVNITALPIGM